MKSYPLACKTGLWPLSVNTPFARHSIHVVKLKLRGIDISIKGCLAMFAMLMAIGGAVCAALGLLVLLVLCFV